MSSRTAVLMFVSFFVVVTAEGSWLSDATGINIDVNKQIGTGIGGMAQPTIDAAETAGHRIIDDADRRAGARVDQIDTILTKQLKAFDDVSATRIADVDLRMEKRIAQIDRLTATRVREIDGILDKDITRIDDVAANRIGQIDTLLKARTTDIDTMLKADILDVDERIGARIDQVDQLTERRLGNLDTIAMKSTNTLSNALLRLIAFACLAIFAAAAVWRVYVESTGAWPANGSLFSRIRQWWAKVRSRLTLQLGSAAACIVLLFVIFAAVIPSGSSGALEQAHLQALQRTLQSLDLTEARYHASQLKVLDPTNPVYRGYAMKIDLLRDVLSRPALYQTPAGIHQVVFRIEQAESEVAPQRDPDIETLKALVVFRTNPSRQNEHDAAMLCAAALQAPAPSRWSVASLFGRSKPKATPADGGFALQPLALSYVENYLSHPLAQNAIQTSPEKDAPAQYSSQQLTEIIAPYRAAAEASANTLTPLSHIVLYNRLVSQLTARSLPAYRQMIEIQAQLSTAQPPQRQELIAARTKAAAAVIQAWKDFDDALAERNSITDTSAAFGVFRLNDVLFTRARAYATSNSVDIPGALNESNYPNPADRARMLPPRVLWAQRYLSNLGTTVHHVVAFQETEKFRSDEEAAQKFEKDYVKYLHTRSDFHQTGDRALVDDGRRASLSAAQIGMAFGVHDLSSEIMSEVQSQLTAKSASDLKFAESQSQVHEAIRAAAVSYL
jgi:hypothetical protein